MRTKTVVASITTAITHSSCGVCDHTRATAPRSSHGAWNSMYIVIIHELRMMLTSLVIRTSRPPVESRSRLP